MYDQAQLQVSVFTLYSIGNAAENLVFPNTELEVWPGEQKQALDGDVTTNQENIKAEGQDANGRKYTQNINTGNVLRAKWLSRNTHRPFPGLVRRGDKVMIWRNADSDEFWWEEMGDDISNRRGDIYTIACISTIVNKDDPISMENAYWFEIDSLNGVIRLSTTQLNNEACTYLFEFMTKEGTFKLEDNKGNQLKLESTDLRWTIANGAETSLIMDAENTTLSMSGKMTINAQNMEFNIDQLFKVIASDFTQEIDNAITVTATTKEETYTASYTLNSLTADMTATTKYSINSPIISLNGALTSTGYGGGVGKAVFRGETDFEGPTNVEGDLTNNGINVSRHDHQGDSGGTTGPMQ